MPSVESISIGIQVWPVNNNDPSAGATDYNNIMQAIDMADSGDTVLLRKISNASDLGFDGSPTPFNLGDDIAIASGGNGERRSIDLNVDGHQKDLIIKGEIADLGTVMPLPDTLTSRTDSTVVSGVSIVQNGQWVPDGDGGQQLINPGTTIYGGYQVFESGPLVHDYFPNRIAFNEHARIEISDIYFTRWTASPFAIEFRPDGTTEGQRGHAKIHNCIVDNSVYEWVPDDDKPGYYKHYRTGIHIANFPEQSLGFTDSSEIFFAGKQCPIVEMYNLYGNGEPKDLAGNYRVFPSDDPEKALMNIKGFVTVGTNGSSFLKTAKIEDTPQVSTVNFISGQFLYEHNEIHMYKNDDLYNLGRKKRSYLWGLSFNNPIGHIVEEGCVAKNNKIYFYPNGGLIQAGIQLERIKKATLTDNSIIGADDSIGRGIAIEQVGSRICKNVICRGNKVWGTALMGIEATVIESIFENNDFSSLTTEDTQFFISGNSSSVKVETNKFGKSTSASTIECFGEGCVIGGFKNGSKGFDKRNDYTETLKSGWERDDDGEIIVDTSGPGCIFLADTSRSNLIMEATPQSPGKFPTGTTLCSQVLDLAEESDELSNIIYKWNRWCASIEPRHGNLQNLVSVVQAAVDSKHKQRCEDIGGTWNSQDNLCVVPE